jgi:hypothetical protein
MENYSVSYEDAVRIVAEFLDGLQLSEINKKSRIKINVHPGFLTTITQGIDDTRKKSLNYGNFHIEVDNIDNIYYLDHVDIMCDALIRLLTYDESEPTTNIPVDRILELCKKQVLSKEKIEVKEVKEVVAKGDNIVLTDNTMFAEPDEGAISFDFENQDKLEEIANTGDGAVEDLLFGDMFDEESGSEEGEGEREEPTPRLVKKEADVQEQVASDESGKSIQDIHFEDAGNEDAVEGEGEGEGEGVGESEESGDSGQ